MIRNKNGKKKIKRLLSIVILILLAVLVLINILAFRHKSLLIEEIDSVYKNWLEIKDHLNFSNNPPPSFREQFFNDKKSLNIILETKYLRQIFEGLEWTWEELTKKLIENIDADYEKQIIAVHIKLLAEETEKRIRINSILNFVLIFLSILSIPGYIGFNALTNREKDKKKNAELKLQNLSSQLLATYEREKKLLSMDIHDDIAQELYTARLLCNKNDQAAKRIESALKKLRNIAYQLQPPELEILGYSEAVEDLCRNLHKPENMRIEYNCSGMNSIKMDYVIKIHLYRIIQESLNNSIKHSGADLISIRLIGLYPSVKLTIKDNGKGFDPLKIPKQRQKTQMGLDSIRERCRLIGGSISIKSGQSKGTKIEITVSLS